MQLPLAKARPDMSVKIVRDVWEGVLDLIYPPFCLVCGEAGDAYLCAKCVEEIDVIEPPFCRRCGIPSESYHCADCREREFAFEFACSAGTYDGVLRKAIHRFKYDPHVVLADPLAQLMLRCFPNTHLGGKVDMIIPIPIHRSRLLRRGFNQAAELSRMLSERISVPVERNVLYKRKKTRPQADLPRDLRESNIADAFGVKNGKRLSGRRVLLVDDVFTTGSTLNEAAGTLKNAGALSVHAFTLARSI